MMDFIITDKELEALKFYTEDGYKAINQMLVSDSETDIALLSDEVEKESIIIEYNRESVVTYLNTIKDLYSLILKEYYKNSQKCNVTLYRGTNLAEVEMLKINPYVDKVLITTLDRSEAENVYASSWNRPASMNIVLSNNIPYLRLGEILKGKRHKNSVIILPFTKVKSISEVAEKKTENNAKTIKVFDIELEKQSIDTLSEEERAGLYKYILDNSIFIKRKIEECINLEKENSINFENIRKLEQLLNKYELADEESDEDENSFSEKEDDIARINCELNELKKASNDLFEIRKENINFINMWKRNIAVYMMAECKEIENEFLEIVEAEEKDDEIDADDIENNDEIVQTEEINNEEKQEEIAPEETDDMSEDSFNVTYNTAICTAEENITSVNKMLANIENFAFNKCGNIQEIYCMSDTPPNCLGDNIFDPAAYVYATLYIPIGCESEYKNALTWKNFSNIVETADFTEENAASALLCYPNPISSTLHIDISPDVIDQVSEISLHDVSGRLVKTQQSGFGSIDISGLAPGMYVMKVALDDGKVLEEKIVKNKFFYVISGLHLENYSYFCSEDEMVTE